jgi:hypothetical protein
MLIKCAFVGQKNFDIYRNARYYNNKKGFIYIYLKQTAMHCRKKSFNPFDNWWTTERFFIQCLKRSSLIVTYGALRGRKLYIITLKIKFALEKSAFYRCVDKEAMWDLEVEASIPRFGK